MCASQVWTEKPLPQAQRTDTIIVTKNHSAGEQPNDLRNGRKKKAPISGISGPSFFTFVPSRLQTQHVSEESIVQVRNW